MYMKGVAVPYIVALLLGILVLSIIVYIVYKFVVKSPLSCQECLAEFTVWCSKCYLVNYPHTDDWLNPGTGMSDELKECVKPERCGLSDPKDDCIGAQEVCKTVGIPPG